MDFFIKEDNIRPGNRGGKNLFKWDDVRLLNNKDRESYLGVTQSIGFLDKGGKWRKRDWWQNYHPDMTKDSEAIQNEKDQLKKDEEKMLREAIFGPGKEKVINRFQATPGQQGPKGKLTDYQWKELLKKEANYNPDDTKLYDFYENDHHRAGLGMKSSISFRTNPYEKGMEKELSKLEGVNVKEEKEEESDVNKEKTGTDGQIKEEEKQKNPILKKYIKEYFQRQEKDKNPIPIQNSKRSKSKSKSKSQSKERSRSRSRDKEEKKTKHKHKHKHHHKKNKK